jgi:acetyl-CoA C-acetyltransferase
MPPIDPRQPVLVGVGQFSNRVDRGATPLEPADLMAEALRRAEADAGVSGLLAATDSIRVLQLLSWRYRDPGAVVAERIGASPRQSVYTVMGGNYVQTLLNASARDIAAGRADVIVLTGGESWRSRAAARADGGLGWTEQGDDVDNAEGFGEDDSLSSPEEIARGLFLPVQLYPMFDSALRAHEGLTLDEHRQVLGQLWSRFSEVAATNPEAWIQRTYSPDELITVTPDNRMVGYPYTKLLNSNNNVEQGAGLILCSVEKARSLGIGEDRWVFPHAGADAHDHWFVSNRAELFESPAIRTAGRAALELAGAHIDDIAHVDLYSCFPSAVRVAARELGLSLDRQLTVTGGMSFAGGPWNNYVMHSIATMTDVLRRDPGSLGLVTANGGYLTKHAFGVYSTSPPAAGFRSTDTQAAVDALPARELDDTFAGAVTIEAYTVMHDRDSQPEGALLATRTPAGQRAWASSTDADVMAELLAAEAVGRSAERSADGTLIVG